MIIGLTGYARSGKDTVASILVEDYGFTRVAFADPIRDLLLKINPILENGYRLGEHVKEFGWELAKARTEVRRLLQDVGVGAREILGADTWVIAALNKMGDMEKNYVVTDVRFQNEVATLTKIDGKIWRVVRPEVTAINSHVSESELANYETDVTILNNGSIEDLRNMVKDYMLGASV